MAFKHHILVSCALGALIAAPSLAQGAAQPTQGTAPSGTNNSSEAGTPPIAQGVGQVPIADGNSAIQEIVVTANKREENLQKVAGTVNAVSQASLIRQGVKEIADITRVVPEVSVQKGLQSNVTIRGVRTGAYGPTTDSPNAVHIDGVYLSRFTSLNGFFFDVQRVEVLAGPQGTLYGRNSAGGTLNVISNKPTMDDVHAVGSLEYGNYNQFTVNAAINVPLSETLAVRAAYYHYSHSGYSNNGLDDAALDSGRISLLWKPSTTDSLLLTADRELSGGKGPAGGGQGNGILHKVIQDPTIYVAVARANGVRSATLSPSPTITNGVQVNDIVPGSGVVVPIIPSANARDSRALSGGAEANKQDIRNQGFMAQYDHDFGFATLTAQASYRKNYVLTSSGANSFIQDPQLVTVGVLRPGAPGYGENHSNSSSQELRLTSPSNQQLTYVVGLFHFRERAYENHSGGYLATYPNTGYRTTASTVGQVVLTLPLQKGMDIYNVFQYDNAFAAFGQATFSPATLEGLHLTGGLRYNYERKHAAGNTILPVAVAGVVGPVNCAGGCFEGRASWKKLTYKANAAFDITPRNSIYVDHSTGFKSGGFAYGIQAQYEPENIKSYEIGSKNRFFGNKLQVNLSAWHYDYRNIVTTIQKPFFNPQLPAPSIGQTITATNGRKAKFDGQTVSIIAQVTPDDSISFNGTHQNARYTEFDIRSQYLVTQTNPVTGVTTTGYLTPGAGPTGDVYNFAGTDISQTPKWAFSATVDHIFHVFDGELDLQGASQYASKRISGNTTSTFDTNNFAAVQMPGYILFDASARFAPTGGRWSLTAYVRNIANKDVVLQQAYNSNNGLLPSTTPGTYAYITRTYGPPRTYGMILSYNF